MKTGFSGSHWKLDRRLLFLTAGLFAVAVAVYFYVGLHSPLR